MQTILITKHNPDERTSIPIVKVENCEELM